MPKSSINIQASHDGSIGHNSREHFSHSVVFTDEKNECSSNQEEAYRLLRAEIEKRSQAYTERTGQKLQKNTVTQLSAVINLEDHHTLKDLEPIKAELEAKFGTMVVQMAIHRDEGKLVSKEGGIELYSGKDFFLNQNDKQLYFDKAFTKPIPMDEYDVVKNKHAHIEMVGLDQNGQAIRQKMNKVALQQLQTFTAQTLGMERGVANNSYTREQMKEITAIVGKKSDYSSSTLYAKKFNEVARDLGYFIEKRKRINTHPFKDVGSERESIKKAELAKIADLKAEITKLREQLKDQGATRADYAQLEAVKKELEAQIKDKNLTIEDLKAKLSEALQSKTPSPSTSEKDKVDLKPTQKPVIKAQEVDLFHGTKFLVFPIIETKEVYTTKAVEKLNEYTDKIEAQNTNLRSENSTLKANLDQQIEKYTRVFFENVKLQTELDKQKTHVIAPKINEAQKREEIPVKNDDRLNLSVLTQENADLKSKLEAEKKKTTDLEKKVTLLERAKNEAEKALSFLRSQYDTLVSFFGKKEEQPQPKSEAKPEKEESFIDGLGKEMGFTPEQMEAFKAEVEKELEAKANKVFFEPDPQQLTALKEAREQEQEREKEYKPEPKIKTVMTPKGIKTVEYEDDEMVQ